MILLRFGWSGLIRCGVIWFIELIRSGLLLCDLFNRFELLWFELAVWFDLIDVLSWFDWIWFYMVWLVDLRRFWFDLFEFIRVDLNWCGLNWFGVFDLVWCDLVWFMCLCRVGFVWFDVFIWCDVMWFDLFDLMWFDMIWFIRFALI